mmetsp:Transcript_5085/g.10983  ORF Transcript_5085/g.10983 Transcript_5085/m.10983 type:complete len:426 (+) Transcript_5085:94-1371(+)
MAAEQQNPGKSEEQASQRTPLLGAGSPIFRKQNSKLLVNEVDLRFCDKWTNSQVLTWLMQTDQKLFIPGAAIHNLSGATMLTLKRDSVADAFACPGAPPPSPFALESLWKHIEALQKPNEAKRVAEKWGEDKSRDDTYGRLLQSPSGWTYDREYGEWDDYLTLFQHHCLLTHVDQAVRDHMSRCQELILVSSSIATLLTSASFVGGNDHKEEGSDSAKVESIRIAVLLISLLTTLLSGYFQMRSPVWKEQLRCIGDFQRAADELTDLYETNLRRPLEDRLTYPEYQLKVREIQSRRPTTSQLDISPAQRAKAYRSIKRTDPSSWAQAFEFQEVRKTGCCSWTWGSLQPRQACSNRTRQRPSLPGPSCCQTVKMLTMELWLVKMLLEGWSVRLKNGQNAIGTLPAQASPLAGDLASKQPAPSEQLF